MSISSDGMDRWQRATGRGTPAMTAQGSGPAERRGSSPRTRLRERGASVLSCGLLASLVVACSVDSRHPEVAGNTLRPGGSGSAGTARSGNGSGPSEAGPLDQAQPAQQGTPDQEGTPAVEGLQPVTMVSGATGASCDGDAASCVSASDAGSACVATGPRDCTSKLDNDCDGLPDDTIDAVCVCAPGSVEPCDTHPGLDGRGQCHPGSRTCSAGAGNATSNWGDCTGSVGPGAQDSCSVEGDDSNCDGTNNGGCPCVEGETRPCGPDAEVGICKKGTQTCTQGAFGACVGAVFPAPRNCSSNADNDCDGHPDNTVDNVCTCTIGSVQACGAHPGRDGNGQCQAGSQRCVAAANNATSAFGVCTGSVGPQAQDTCAAGNDANCNGVPNEGCACVNGQTRACGPDTDVGICQRGTQTCANGVFGQCQGAVFPGVRNCMSQQDNDCDGRPDNTIDSVCTCTVGAVQACGTHPGRDGNGPCRAGSQTCQGGANNATSGFGACTGSVGPGVRNCASPADNDCDGRPDNTFDNVCLAPTNPFTCSNANPPDTVLPFDLFNTDPNTGLPISPAGAPPAGSGGTVRNGRYVPTHVDVFGAAAAPAFTVFEMTFEFRDGFVQIGYQIFIGTGAVLASDDVQFVGSFASVGNTLRFSNVQGCEPPPCTSFTGLSCVVPASLAYSVTATGLVTIQPASDGSTVVITYTRQ